MNCTCVLYVYNTYFNVSVLGITWGVVSGELQCSVAPFLLSTHQKPVLMQVNSRKRATTCKSILCTRNHYADNLLYCIADHQFKSNTYCDCLNCAKHSVWSIILKYLSSVHTHTSLVKCALNFHYIQVAIPQYLLFQSDVARQESMHKHKVYTLLCILVPLF